MKTPATTTVVIGAIADTQKSFGFLFLWKIKLKTETQLAKLDEHIKEQNTNNLVKYIV